VSIKQKRLQLLANPGWQTVPEPWSSGCEAPIAEPCVGRSMHQYSERKECLRSQ